MVELTAAEPDDYDRHLLKKVLEGLASDVLDQGYVERIQAT